MSMNAIIGDAKSIQGLGVALEERKHLVSLVLLPYEVIHDEVFRTELEEVIRVISQEETVVLAIDPSFPYPIVGEFSLPNVHILRLLYPKGIPSDTLLPLFVQDGIHDVGVDFEPQDCPRIGRDLLLELTLPRYPLKSLPFSLPTSSLCYGDRGVAFIDSYFLGRFSFEEAKVLLKENLNLGNVLFLSPLYESKGEISRYLCYLGNNTVAINPAYLRKSDLDAIASLGYQIIHLPKSYGSDSYTSLYQNDTTVFVPQFDREEDSKALSILSSFYEGKKKVVPVKATFSRYSGHSLRSYLSFIPYSPLYEIFPKEEKSTHQFYKEEKASAATGNATKEK